MDIRMRSNVKEFNRLVLETEKQLEQLPRVIMGIVTIHFEQLIYETPQWSGTLTANWRISVGTSRPGYIQLPIPASESVALSKGDQAAVGMAISANTGISDDYAAVWKASAGTVGFSVYNPVEYASKVENGEVNLREYAGNYPGFFAKFKSDLHSAFQAPGWFSFGKMSSRGL